MPATAMAIDYGASGSSEGDQLLAIRSCAKLTECRLGSQQVDPILSQLSAARASELEWPVIKKHLHTALQGLVPTYLARGPPRSIAQPQSPPVPGPSFSPSASSHSRDNSNQASGPSHDEPPADSLLLSPSQPITSLNTLSTPPTATAGQSNPPGSIDVEPSTSPTQNLAEDLQPSTPGGLIIPPFPPLDPHRRRKSSGSGTTPVISIPRMNGGNRAPPGPMLSTPYDDEWDEEVVIGGRTLPGFLQEEDGKKEVDRIARLVDNLDETPYTIQRIAELLLDPTRCYTTLGKFLRALEKSLLVTSSWEAPSYVPLTQSSIPSSSLYRSTSISSLSTASTSGSSDRGSDEDSMMPPGSLTPMFSPIPFLSHEEGLGMDIDSLGPGEGNGHMEGSGQGLMSPLMLGGEDSSGAPFRFDDAPAVPSARSPESDEQNGSSPALMTDDAASSSPIAPPLQENSDPANQPYLGRVDELDTGPLPSTPDATSTPPSQISSGYSEPSSQRRRRGSDESQTSQTGAGEGGTMTPHGMSDKPVPISSTTVVDPALTARPIASLPKVQASSLAERFVPSTGDSESAERTP